MEVAEGIWQRRSSFILAAIGSAVGLGNVWRFPYICYQNGGGAFLIPYFVALFTTGIPLMILEFGLGHMMQGSAPKSFCQVKKRAEWVGWWAIMVGFFITTYYAVIMSWCFSYLVHSLKLSWGDSAETFFKEGFLHLSSGPGSVGGIRWPILLGLLLTWIFIYLCISKGTRSVGKVVLITVPLPVMLLAILVVRGITLPGAIEGLRFYLTPNFSALKDPKVWLAAYSQIFFSLSLGFGVLIAYASYLPRKSDIVNNAFITSLANCGTSFFAGFAVFSTLGYLALATNKGVGDVVSGAEGLGLAFVTYPTVIRLLPFAASIFGILFFLMLLTLGIDSAFSLVEAAVAGGMDRWGLNRRRANLLFCSVAFLLGIIFTTKGGLHWLDIVDHFLNNFGLVPVCLAECLVIGYLFGPLKLRSYANKNSDFSIRGWWDILIRFVSPLILLGLLGKVVWEKIRIPYGEGNYPNWALGVGGWGVVGLVLVLAIIFMFIKRRR